MRVDLTCGGFPLYIWRLKLQQFLSYISPLQNKLVLTLTVDFVIQSQTEKQNKLHNLEGKESWNMSDFALGFLKASDFKSKNFTFLFILPGENELFCFFVLLLKACFCSEKFTTFKIFKEKTTTRQTLKYKNQRIRYFFRKTNKA